MGKDYFIGPHHRAAEGPVMNHRSLGDFSPPLEVYLGEG